MAGRRGGSGRSLTLKGLITAILGLVAVYIFGDLGELGDLIDLGGERETAQRQAPKRESPKRETSRPKEEPEELAGRPKVVDGDTIKIDGETLRLLGMDAPEKKQTCRAGGREVACGEQATDHLEKLIGSRGVACEIDKKRDKYGRGLARCEAGGRDLAETMIKDGWAVSFMETRYDAAQAAARAGRRGLWAMQFDQPADWRKAQRSSLASMPDPTATGAIQDGDPDL